MHAAMLLLASGCAGGDDIANVPFTGGSTTTHSTVGAATVGAATVDTAGSESWATIGEGGLSASAGADGANATGSSQGEVTVQNYIMGNCANVYWCHKGGTGQGPHAYAECFVDVSLEPPFDVTRISYKIGRRQDATPTFGVEIRAWTGNGPGDVLATEFLEGSDASPGWHDIDLSVPATIEDSSFCVVLSGSNAFGISLDKTETAPYQSFYRAEKCGFSSWSALSSSSSAANLCMAAVIRK